MGSGLSLRGEPEGGGQREAGPEPGQADAEAGQNVGGVVDAQIDAAEPDRKNSRAAGAQTQRRAGAARVSQ